MSCILPTLLFETLNREGNSGYIIVYNVDFFIGSSVVSFGHRTWPLNMGTELGSGSL